MKKGRPALMRAPVPASQVLRTFLEKQVMNNMYIIDLDGVIAFWLKNFNGGVLLNVLTKQTIEAGCVAICDVLENYVKPEVLTNAQAYLRAILAKNYPLALVPNCRLCVIPECDQTRMDTKYAACLKHTCQLCMRFVGDPKWRPTFANDSAFQSMGQTPLVHMIPRTMTGDETEMRRSMKICATLWSTRRIEMAIVCPGDLQPCLGCKSMVLPHLVMEKDETLPIILRYCSACWIADKCKHATDTNGHLRATATEHYERHMARVCMNPECTRRGCCKVCKKVWFMQPPAKSDDKRYLLLCIHCRNNHVICQHCGRTSYGGGVFFAPQWLGRNEPNTIAYCVFCFQHAPRIIGHPKKEFQHSRRIACLIEWRIMASRERAYFEAELKRDLRGTLQRLLLPMIERRELAHMRLDPEAFWRKVEQNCELWDCTFWLMYQMALLPRDVWLMIMRRMHGPVKAKPSSKMSVRGAGADITIVNEDMSNHAAMRAYMNGGDYDDDDPPSLEEIE